MKVIQSCQPNKDLEKCSSAIQRNTKAYIKKSLLFNHIGEGKPLKKSKVRH